MAEYISRNDALKAIGETIPAMGKPDESGERDEMTHAAMEMCADIISVLKDIPAADVAPVVHGEWLKEVYRDPYGADWTRCVCSLCGRVEIKKEPYCNCGAKMDGGEKPNE